MRKGAATFIGLANSGGIHWLFAYQAFHNKWEDVLIFSRTLDILRRHSCHRLEKCLEVAQLLNLQVASSWEGTQVYHKIVLVSKIILTGEVINKGEADEGCQITIKAASGLISAKCKAGNSPVRCQQEGAWGRSVWAYKKPNVSQWNPDGLTEGRSVLRHIQRNMLKWITLKWNR